MFQDHARSTQSEWLDADNIPTDELYKNLDELDFINKTLGGHNATLQGIEAIIKKYPQQEYTLLDIGCGGGDTMLQVAKWAKKRNIKIHITGIDLLQDAITYCNQKYIKQANLHFVQKDFNDLAQPYDIVMCNLVCHHLYGDTLKALLQTMQKKSILGFVINDLHRNIWAYNSIKMLTKLFSKSKFIKNDAPLSVARGFKRHELQELLQNAAIRNFTIKWVWAFRYLILHVK